MAKPLELWENRYHSLQRSARVGQTAVAKGTAYIFRVGHTHFEAAFAGYLVQPDGDWHGLLQEALRLFALSAQSDDCRSKEDYPFNLAQLYVE